MKIRNPEAARMIVVNFLEEIAEDARKKFSESHNGKPVGGVCIDMYTVYKRYLGTETARSADFLDVMAVGLLQGEKEHDLAIIREGSMNEPGHLFVFVPVASGLLN